MRSNTIIATIVMVSLALACTGLVYAGDSIIISNPSFQADYIDVDAGNLTLPYCPYGWTFPDFSSGGVGVSAKTESWENYVFWDNGKADQSQVAYIQNIGYLSQSLNGLQVGKQYWLQCFYNAHSLDDWARGRPFSAPLIDMYASFDGTNLGTITVHPMEDIFQYSKEFFCATFPFTPTSSTGTIAIGTSSVVDDGNSLMIDCVSVIQRNANEAVVRNPSFEGSGINSWFIVGVQVGWDSSWTSSGVCHQGEAFADNGTPDGQCVGFMQGQNSKLSQTITGLQAGKLYMLSYYYNIRAGTVYGGMKVTLGSTVVQDSPSLTAVGGTNPYYRNAYFFVSDGTDQTLTFMETKAGDCTCLVDNVSIKRIDYDTTADSIANLQSVTDGQVVRLTSPQVVTAVYDDTFYIEDVNRIAGIKVVGTGVQLGDRVDLVGGLGTDSTNGERYLLMQAYSRTPGDPLKPLGMTNKSLGGGHTGYQPGITDASGLNNIGLFVKTTGKVTSCVTEGGKSNLIITDGSGVNVRVQDLPKAFCIDDYVSVTGACSVYREIDDTLTRTILPRNGDDVTVLDTVPAVCQAGWQIYNPGSANGYRYGPAIIINNDNSIDMWLSSQGDGSSSGVWDCIRYRHSTDGGHTWTPDVIALSPTAGSMDASSNCDPNVVKFGGYYYIGYSVCCPPNATTRICVARSTSPTGPFQKWNGSGWGGNPQAVIDYTGETGYFGIGEPSMVLLGGKLYIYYTFREDKWDTYLAICDDPTAADWPAHLRYIGNVITHPTTPETDSVDVKYVDSLGRFIGMAVTDRFSSSAAIMMWESRDGINWSQAQFKGVPVEVGAHNVGISGTETGHFDTNKNNFIAYGYQPVGYSWAKWPTYLNPFYLEIAE